MIKFLATIWTSKIALGDTWQRIAALVTTHYNNHHKDLPKSKLLYDSELKLQKQGNYKDFNGYECSICQLVVKCLKRHCIKAHPDIDIKGTQFQNMLVDCNTETSQYNKILLMYERHLQDIGVGKRNPVNADTAKTYMNQVKKMIQNPSEIQDPKRIFINIEESIVGDGQDGTKYAYLATLKNFLEFVDLEYPMYMSESVHKLIKYTVSWLSRQRAKKEKRQNIVKQHSRKKLSGLPQPYRAILEYEQNHGMTIAELRRSEVGSLSKSEVQELCGDVFLRVVCRAGCRPSVLTGVTIEELDSAEKTSKGNYSIYVKDQKLKNEHACLVLSVEELHDMRTTSNHLWATKKQKSTKLDKVFPSISCNRKMESTEFNRYWKKTSSQVFHSTNNDITVTDVRKLITMVASKQSKSAQIAIARSKGHSIAVAHKVYDISHPHELVEQGRTTLQQLANDEKCNERPTDSRSAEEERGARLTDPNTAEEERGARLTDPDPTGVDKETDLVCADLNKDEKFIRVAFSDDPEVIDIYRVRDLKTKNGKRIKQFNEIKMEEECKARWPADNLFYPARRVVTTWSPCKQVRSDDEFVAESPFKRKRKKKLLY
ncbi:uncharacterized protein LOC144745816 [Ciona intestinalis]